MTSDETETQVQQRERAAVTQAVIEQAEAECRSVHGEVRNDFVVAFLATTVVELARGVSSGYARLGLQPRRMGQKPEHKAVSEI